MNGEQPPNTIVIECRSTIEGKEFQFAIRVDADNMPPELAIEAYVIPAVEQIAMQLEHKLLGTCHDYNFKTGELIA